MKLSSLIDLLKQEGLVKLEDYFLDGTKIEQEMPIDIRLYGKIHRKI